MATQSPIVLPVRFYEPDYGAGTHYAEYHVIDSGNPGCVVAKCSRRASALAIVEALNAKAEVANANGSN